jgi:2-iminobutanoate/2-iminopropanoate deaminase
VSVSKKFPEAVNPGGHMPSGLPFSEGMIAGNLVFLSGQLGTLPGKLELNNKTTEDEFRQVMDNVFSTLRANGLGAKNVVKCLVMLADMKDWPAFNKIYLEYFEAPYPARSAFGANGLALNARVELEVIAMRSET